MPCCDCRRSPSAVVNSWALGICDRGAGCEPQVSIVVTCIRLPFGGWSWLQLFVESVDVCRWDQADAAVNSWALGVCDRGTGCEPQVSGVVTCIRLSSGACSRLQQFVESVDVCSRDLVDVAVNSWALGICDRGTGCEPHVSSVVTCIRLPSGVCSRCQLCVESVDVWGRRISP